MKIGIIGSGTVAQMLGLGFANSGHDVKVGTRYPGKLNDWLQKAGGKTSVGSNEEAAKFGEMIVLATKWADGATENAIRLAGKINFAGKIVMDVTNPLTSNGDGRPPELAVGYPQSAGATIQNWLADSKVVKAFNIVTAYYMANPRLKQGTPDMFIAGNDTSAKRTVTDIAAGWGWEVHDIGDIRQAYLLEALAMLWIRYGFLNNNWKHAFKLLKE
jgi:predicted dinucleotide-binding enzyme